MPPQPTMLGRFIAGTIGLLIGGAVTYQMTKDYEIIKFTPPELDTDGTPKVKKFQVHFREMQPLELKPEVRARREARAITREQIQEAEQIIQEPTT